MIDLVIKLAEKVEHLARHSADSNWRRFSEIFQPMFESVETIHQNYRAMFDVVYRSLPLEWEVGSEDYGARLQIAASNLIRLRNEFAPVRVKVAIASRVMAKSSLRTTETDFCVAVVNYLPTGSVTWAESGPGNSEQSRATSVIEKLYVELQMPGLVNPREFVIHTIKDIDLRWEQVCHAYANIQKGLAKS